MRSCTRSRDRSGTQTGAALWLRRWQSDRRKLLSTCHCSRWPGTGCVEWIARPLPKQDGYTSLKAERISFLSRGEVMKSLS